MQQATKASHSPSGVTWRQHVERWKDCTNCALCSQRDNIVLARGTVPCDVLFIGEAPGESENLIGQPFVGPAGHLLERIIASALHESGSKATVAYTNLVACFPKLAKDRGDNEPEQDEIEACADRLTEFLTIAKPKLVVAVGKLAGDNLPQLTKTLRTVIITHPAAILRMPLVQQGMAAEKCVVIISNALEEL